MFYKKHLVTSSVSFALSILVLCLSVNTVFAAASTNDTPEFAAVSDISESAVLKAAAPNVTVNGKQLPFSNYTNGKFYSKVSNGCRCHGRSRSCSWKKNSAGLVTATYCDCLCYAGATQCWAFALYTLDQVFGTSSTVVHTDYNVKNGTINTADSIKNILNKLPQCSHLRISTASNTEHSVIFVKQVSDGAIMYDANYNNNCNIRYFKMTYPQLNDMIQRVLFTEHVHTYSTRVSRTIGGTATLCYTDILKCNCGASKSVLMRHHSYSYQAPPIDRQADNLGMEPLVLYSRCSICGYQKPIS